MKIISLSNPCSWYQKEHNEFINMMQLSYEAYREFGSRNNRQKNYKKIWQSKHKLKIKQAL